MDREGSHVFPESAFGSEQHVTLHQPHDRTFGERAALFRRTRLQAVVTCRWELHNARSRRNMSVSLFQACHARVNG